MNKAIEHDVLKRIQTAGTLIFLAAIVQVVTSYAQTPQFRHYSSDEGFTGAAFKQMAQDSLGFLWIASGSGLYKFDGYTFTSYRAIPNDTFSLPQDLVPRIWVDPKGRVWTGFTDRIAYYDRDLDGFRSFRVPLGGTHPESAFFERDQVIWLGTAGEGLVRYDISTRGYRSVVNKSGKSSTALAKTNTILGITDEGDSFLLATAQGIWKMNKNTGVFSRPPCNASDSSQLYHEKIRKIISAGSYYWVWTDKHLSQLTRTFSIINSLDFNIIKQRFDNAGTFGGEGIKSIVRDSNGLFWIATQGLGLIKYDPTRNELTNFRADRNDGNSLPSDVLEDVIIDRNENIWIATLPKGIAQIRKRSLEFINSLAGISTNKLHIMPTNKGDQLVVVSQGEGIFITELDTMNFRPLSFNRFEPASDAKGFKGLVTIYQGKDHLWIGSLAAGVMGLPINKESGALEAGPVKFIRHDPNNINTIPTNNLVGPIGEDADGNFFLNSRANGLFKLVPSVEYGQKGSVINYRHDDNDTTTLANDFVNGAIIDADYGLLVTTQSGVDRFRNGKFEHIFKSIPCTRILKHTDGTLYIATKSGLYEGTWKGGRFTFVKAPIPGDPFITSIHEDRLGRIWCTSYEGLIFYDRVSKQSLMFKKEDGLPSSRTLSGAGGVQTRDGIMILSNSEGITLFDPLSLQINRSKPKPVLTQLKVNNEIVHSSSYRSGENASTINESINTIQELTFNYTQNIITLEFSALDHTAPERNLYSYQLVGFDKEPVLTDWKDRTATYTNLRPGDYTFRVKASNRDGIWNDYQTETIIHVLPPPWKTWWAYGLYGIAISGLLFLARRSIIKQERLASKLALEHLELEKVQEIDRAKTNFFANISHEFRTPLTLIQGPVQNLLEKFKGDPSVKDQLDLVQNNSDRLLRLVNQILELARLESGTLKNETSNSNIIHFLRQVVGSFSSLAIQKKISFIQQFPDYEVKASFDKDKLEKISSNLISNALKFTGAEGAVIVNVSVTTSNASGQLILRVTDTGKGVPEDQASKIFERFYQVSEDGNINVGSGIGLALCKELAEFLGGSLTLESKVGEGSRFTLALPLEYAEKVIETKAAPVLTTSFNEETPTNGAVPTDDHTEKPIVLVVEDHADLRKFIITCLGGDYNFIEASNGKDGLNSAIEQIPMLVLSDVMMPEMDGLEMCKKIKQDPRTSHIPVILLTAKASDESKLSGLGIGADDYIIKPFNREELKLKIRNQVVARARMQERIRLEFLSASTSINAVSADEKFLERLRKIIEARISDELLSVESLTEEIGMSRAQLYRKVTALTGLSGNEFIRKLRLQRAAQLLQQHVGPVSQVAYDVGFSNLSYFSKCFKEQFGMLPSEYRNGR